eukprot:jgi/Psemu1/284698/fgenesh1_pg.61_\
MQQGNPMMQQANSPMHQGNPPFQQGNLPIPGMMQAHPSTPQFNPQTCHYQAQITQQQFFSPQQGKHYAMPHYAPQGQPVLLPPQAPGPGPGGLWGWFSCGSQHSQQTASDKGSQLIPDPATLTKMPVPLNHVPSSVQPQTITSAQLQNVTSAQPQRVTSAQAQASRVLNPQGAPYTGNYYGRNQASPILVSERMAQFLRQCKSGPPPCAPSWCESPVLDAKAQFVGAEVLSGCLDQHDHEALCFFLLALIV